jgi:hypothetical protein
VDFLGDIEGRFSYIFAVQVAELAGLCTVSISSDSDKEEFLIISSRFDL